MSNVVKGVRVPGQFRAAVHLTLGCVLLGGCSASSDRFSSASLGSGYEGTSATAGASAPPGKIAANNWRPAQPVARQAAPAAGSGYQLASADASQPAGYLQVSRVDLPPLPQRQDPSRTKTADGYGRFNPPPAEDGTYAGPRVYLPQDDARRDPPPAPPYTPDNDDGQRRFDRWAPPAGQYRSSEDARDDGHAYAPHPDRGYHDDPPYRGDRGPSYDGVPERQSYYSPPNQTGAGPAPAKGRGEGEKVRVEPGDTLNTLARRYGVTPAMIARANGLPSEYLRPGTIIYIPRADPAAYAASSPARSAQPCTQSRCHRVRPGETLAGIARSYRLPEKRIAEANNLAGWRLKAGQTIVIPAGKEPPAQSQDRAAVPVEQAPAPAAPAASEPAGKTAKPAPVPAPAPAQPAPEIKTAELGPAPEPSCESLLANPQPRMGNTFRKPVEGKTIAQFGPQKDGTVNEGVTISVPKGTPIKAAENGVVAYVGDELPGFGNLVLIRHADEYVTAYAHADAVQVKKCDVVKRGQIIGTAGTTGDASQPQLHFEIRKNSKPVDPSPLVGS